MIEMKPPPSLAVVVESDVIGLAAVSVPVRKHNPPTEDPRQDLYFVGFDPEDVEAELEILETNYLDSHREPADVEIDVEYLAKAASDAVVMGNYTWDTLAADCGWTRQDKGYSSGRRGDGQKVRELLGITRGPNTVHRPLAYDDAQALVRAVGLDPVDVGL